MLIPNQTKLSKCSRHCNQINICTISASDNHDSRSYGYGLVHGMDKNMLPKSLHRHWQPALCFHWHDHCLSYNSWSMLQLIFVLQIHQVRNRERTAMWLFTSSHIIIDDIPYHLCRDKSFSSNRILSWIWTDENQCWQPTDLKIL